MDPSTRFTTRRNSGAIVKAEIESLLAVQADDEVVSGLERRLAALDPRMREMEEVRGEAERALERAREAVESEERKLADLRQRVAEHRQMQDRNLAQFDSVKKQKEATAATLQVEQVRRILAQEESVMESISSSLAEMREIVAEQEARLAELETSQQETREQLAQERGEIEKELSAARRKRESLAKKVSGPLLAKYERIQKKRGEHALYPLRGSSCGNCDNAVPMQRRSHMMRSGSIELCETCGVLLYASE